MHSAFNNDSKLINFCNPNDFNFVFEQFQNLLSEFVEYSAKNFVAEVKIIAEDQQKFLLEKFTGITEDFKTIVREEKFIQLSKIDLRMKELQDVLRTTPTYLSYLTHQHFAIVTSTLHSEDNESYNQKSIEIEAIKNQAQKSIAKAKMD